MKKPTLIVISLLAAVPAFAQERPRYFDNFDTSRGVQVVRQDFVPVAARSKPVVTTKAGKKLIAKTAKVTPTGQ